jgi:hypothetical protein
MTKYFYYFLKILISLTLALFAVFIVFKTYQSWLDPVDVLRKTKIATKVIYEKSYQAHDAYHKRVFTDVVLSTKKNNKIYFTVSLPKNSSNKPLKCIFLVAGLETGQKSLSYVEDHADYAIIAYEYSPVIKQFHKNFSFFSINKLKDTVISIPQDWLSIINWVRYQPWCQTNAISIAGFSFGAIFIPATYHLAQVENVQLGPGIIAYAGVGIKCLLNANLKVNKWLKKPLSWFGSVLFRPVDPLVHAGHLKNYFLIINGLNDDKIPTKCRKDLQRAIPKPKKIINLQTKHMSPDDQPLLNRLVRISKDFLAD